MQGGFLAVFFFLFFTTILGSCSRKTSGSFKNATGADIFSNEYIKKTMIKVTNWQLNHPLHAPTDWTNGAFYAGVMAAYKTTQSQQILDSLMALGQRTGWQPGRRYDHADDIVISQTYLDLYRIKNDPQMIRATIDTVQKMRTIPGPESKKGLMWWWCDALFMAPPTLVKLGVILNDPSYFALNDSLFRQTYDLLYNKEHHLFARDASYLLDAAGGGKREANGQPVFWSRGNGWVMGGLVRILEELPSNHPTRSFICRFTRRWRKKFYRFNKRMACGVPASSIPHHIPAAKAVARGFTVMH